MSNLADDTMEVVLSNRTRADNQTGDAAVAAGVELSRTVLAVLGTASNRTLVAR